jgi:hypothetical protein
LLGASDTVSPAAAAKLWPAAERDAEDRRPATVRSAVLGAPSEATPERLLNVRFTVFGVVAPFSRIWTKKVRFVTPGLNVSVPEVAA